MPDKVKRSSPCHFTSAYFATVADIRPWLPCTAGGTACPTLRGDESTANAALESRGIRLGRLTHCLRERRSESRIFTFRDHGQGSDKIRHAFSAEGNALKLSSHISANYLHNKQIYDYQEQYHYQRADLSLALETSLTRLG